MGTSLGECEMKRQSFAARGGDVVMSKYIYWDSSVCLELLSSLFSLFDLDLQIPTFATIFLKPKTTQLKRHSH